MNIKEEFMLLGLYLIGMTAAAFWGYQLAKFRYYRDEDKE